jgi:acyl-CoA dehydrogenase
MMIDFELPPEARKARDMIHGLGENLFRKIARKYDNYDMEHKEVEELKNLGGLMASARQGRDEGKDKKAREVPEKSSRRRNASLVGVVTAEEMAWADVGLMLAIPGRGVGNAAIDAIGSPEKKARFGKISASMAITEPGCGSDSSAICTTAHLDRDTNEWVINGEKIFVTGGKKCDAVVVWASIDRTRGRQAIKSFFVPRDTPGVTLTKLEKKMGIRASDTAAIVFEDVRIPYDNILDSAEISSSGGFKGVMKTFDATRPGVAALAIGVARAALDFTIETLEKEGFTFTCHCARHRLSAVQRDVLDMEAHLDAARLLTWRAAAMLDEGQRNSLEASMAKAKAGRAATLVTQKCVEVLGPMGYSCQWLAEKWMRDSKINDIYEGTGQIQCLIIARAILGYGKDMLK